MFKPCKAISEEILEMIEWLDGDQNTDYERGVLTGLRMAECLAEAVERNSEVSDGGNA